MNVAGIVLAAGAGRRFGAPKALVDFGGQTLVERAVATLRGGGCLPVIVVLGAQAAEVVTTVTFDDVVVAVNDRWPDGLASSLQVGLAAAARTQAAAAVVALVDQPLVTPEAIGRLISAFRTGATAVVATYDGRRRNPALFARDVWDAVAAEASGETGARTWLRTHPDLVTDVECGDVASADDIDDRIDLATLMRLEQEWQ